MKYLVQYSLNDQRRAEEVEAGSPEEAVVKFRMTRTDRSDRRGKCRVLSVAPEPACIEPAW